MKNNKTKDRRKAQYRALKAAGFNSYEATRFKDFSSKKIVLLIEGRNAYTKSVFHVVSGVKS